MIKEGMFTIIDLKPYRCVKIEAGVAFFQSATDETRGRLKEIPVELAPYFDEKGDIVNPAKPSITRKRLKRFDFMKAVKEETEMSLSHDLAYFIAEHLDNLVRQLALNAESNAKKNGDERITSAHWYWLDIPVNSGEGYWPNNVEIAKDYKKYLGVK
jgi:hypothetical protein